MVLAATGSAATGSAATGSAALSSRPIGPSSDGCVPFLSEVDDDDDGERCVHRCQHTNAELRMTF